MSSIKPERGVHFRRQVFALTVLLALLGLSSAPVADASKTGPLGAFKHRRRDRWLRLQLGHIWVLKRTLHHPMHRAPTVVGSPRTKRLIALDALRLRHIVLIAPVARFRGTAAKQR